MSAKDVKRVMACRMSFAGYGAIDAVNWSTLREATKSGLAYQHRLANPPSESDAMRLGRAVHTATFEPDRLLTDYVLWTGGRRAGAAWEDFRAIHAGRTILKPDEYDTACRIRDAVHAHKAAAKLLKSGAPECALTWTDEETGLPCKARLDWLSTKALVDLKTTRDIELRAFGRHAGSMLYHCQFAFAAMGLRAHGIDVAVKIIAVENEPPHDVAVYELSEDVLWAGEVKVREALRVVAACRRSKRWPGRYPTEMLLLLPDWEWPSEEEELGIVVGGMGA